MRQPLVHCCTAAQTDRLAAVAGQDNVSVGVVMSGQEPVLPFPGFTIYADRGEEDREATT